MGVIYSFSDFFQILCVIVALGEDPVLKKEKGT